MVRSFGTRQTLIRLASLGTFPGGEGIAPQAQKSFSRGEAAPVRTLGLKRNAGDHAGYGRQKRPANILPIRMPHADAMWVDFCPYSSSVSHLHSKCDPPSPRGKVCACGAINNNLHFYLPIVYTFSKEFARVFDNSSNLLYNISATGSDSRGCKLKSCR